MRAVPTHVCVLVTLRVREPPLKRPGAGWQIRLNDPHLAEMPAVNTITVATCYIRQVNGVKLAEIMFSLVCVRVCVCARTQSRWFEWAE